MSEITREDEQEVEKIYGDDENEEGEQDASVEFADAKEIEELNRQNKT